MLKYFFRLLKSLTFPLNHFKKVVWPHIDVLKYLLQNISRFIIFWFSTYLSTIPCNSMFMQTLFYWLSRYLFKIEIIIFSQGSLDAILIYENTSRETFKTSLEFDLAYIQLWFVNISVMYKPFFRLLSSLIWYRNSSHNIRRKSSWFTEISETKPFKIDSI